MNYTLWQGCVPVVPSGQNYYCSFKGGYRRSTLSKVICDTLIKVSTALSFLCTIHWNPDLQPSTSQWWMSSWERVYSLQHLHSGHHCSKLETLFVPMIRLINIVNWSSCMSKFLPLRVTMVRVEDDADNNFKLWITDTGTKIYHQSISIDCADFILFLCNILL